MKSILATSLSLALLALPAVAVSTAEDFFHVGASNFLASKTEPALMAVTNGLRLDPQNVKLKKLEELLRQQQQQEQNQDQQDKQDQEKKDEQQKKDQEKKDQQKKQDEQKKDSQQSKEEEKKKQEEQAKKDQEKKDEQDKQGSSPKDKKEEGKPEEGQPEGMAAMKMSLEDAVRFLETLKFNEQAMPFKPPMRTNRQDRLFKDW
jgi:Ca-activated chloride channel homolog